MNAGELWPDPYGAERRVRRMQAKLHHWAVQDQGRRFNDLFNLVYHPDFLTMAWERVRGNKGARTAGVDRVIPRFISEDADVVAFLGNAREQLKARTFTPLPVREVLIAKAGQPGRYRRLGIPSALDRLVQASLVLVLEPVFEADFKPVSYGFRPMRRAQDAIAEVHYLATRNYRWVFEGDIAACFDELSHHAILERVRRRIADKRILALIKAFLKAGIMPASGLAEDTITGTPQGGIASPLLANIALSVLDEHFCAKWDTHGGRGRRETHRKRGGATYRIVRYADDFVIMVAGSKAHADALWEEASSVLAPLGLRLSEAKTQVRHIDEGFDFLGFRIQRQTKRGTVKKYVYTWPSKKSLNAVIGKVRALTNSSRHPALAALLRQLNPVLRGWCNYFRHGVSKQTLSYLDSYTWWRVVSWIRRRHKGLGWGKVKRRLLPGWQIKDGNTEMFRPRSVHVTRYRYRGTSIPTPWDEYTSQDLTASGNPWSAGCEETRTSGAEGGPGKRTGGNPSTAPRSDPYTIPQGHK